MTSYERTYARRKKRRNAGRAFLFITLLLGIIMFTVIIHAFAAQSVAAGGEAADRDSVKQTAQTPESYITQNDPLAGDSIDSDDWRLLLVNPWNSLPADFEVTLTKIRNGHAVDERCYPDLQRMMDDCRAAGLQPLICSSYRTLDYQKKLFNNKVNNLIAQGYTADAAREKAATSIAVPGTSEHHTGLALDIVDINNQNLDNTQENTPTQKWLMENSWQYGFILRYPRDKIDITGITYEPWHYRYVGKEAAREIAKNGLCFEEYIAERG